MKPTSLLSAHHVDRSAAQLASLAGLIALLYVVGGVGMAYVAGFGAVGRRLGSAQWWWLGPSFGAVLLGFCGYFFAYRGIDRVERGQTLSRPALLAVVTAGLEAFWRTGARHWMSSRCERAGRTAERRRCALVRWPALSMACWR